MPIMSTQPMEWFEADELTRVLKEFISIDKDLEGLKQMLSLKTDFNLEDCSKIFGMDKLGVITLKQLEETYNTFKLYPNNEELELIMERYDKDRDGKLNF